MVARRYVIKKKQNGGARSRTIRPSNSFKTKSPGIMTKSWHYTKKGLGHAFRAPAYIVRGASAGVGGLVGLGVTRLGSQAIRGIQLKRAKAAQTSEQRKMNTLLGLESEPTSRWGKFKSIQVSNQQKCLKI